MAVALGSSPETSHLPSLYKLSAHLHGSVGLLFTNSPPTQILAFFSSYSATSFARAGVHATSSFTVPAGVVYSTGGQQSAEEDVPVAHSVEPTLRKWGMPTRLVKGKIMLEDEYRVCKEGQTLDSNQTALLKMFGVAMAEFRIKVTA
jgi:mRNA turnover protein 4